MAAEAASSAGVEASPAAAGEASGAAATGGEKASRATLISPHLPRLRRQPVPGPARAPGVGDEVDYERNSLEPVVLAEPVLQVERPLAGDQAPVVHLNREARRAATHLGG